MSLRDTPNSYGWISIIFHWIVAITVITLWFIGDSISTFDDSEKRNAYRNLHISIGACAYLFLWFRIGWRLRSGHPKLDDQGRLDHFFANMAHYILLTAIAAMLLTGPLLVWSTGASISVFDWFSIPSPTGFSITLYQFVYRVHSISAIIILCVSLAHMAGAFKHLMFDDDEIFLRMLVPLRKSTKDDGK